LLNPAKLVVLLPRKSVDSGFDEQYFHCMNLTVVTGGSNPIFWSVGFAAVLVGLVFAFLLRKATARGRFPDVTPEWISELGTARYRPMERLLREDDYHFLRSQPGADAKMIRRLRAERRQIFRGYLRCLQRDFMRVSDALRMLMLTSHEDRPDLAAALLKQRVAFTVGVTVVRLRIAMRATDWAADDIRELIGALDTVRHQFQQLASVPAAAAATV